MSEPIYTNLKRLTWRAHAKGPGIATFEYVDGGHDHQEMSHYHARNFAQRFGLLVVQERNDVEEWVRP